jgi:hypothetical protein
MLPTAPLQASSTTTATLYSTEKELSLPGEVPNNWFLLLKQGSALLYTNYFTLHSSKLLQVVRLLSSVLVECGSNILTEVFLSPSRQMLFLNFGHFSRFLSHNSQFSSHWNTSGQTESSLRNVKLQNK